MIYKIIKLQAVLTFSMIITIRSRDMVDQVKDYDEHYKDEDNAEKIKLQTELTLVSKTTCPPHSCSPYVCWDEDLDHNDDDGGRSNYKDYNDYHEDDDNNRITNGNKKVTLISSTKPIPNSPEITITVGSVKFQYGNQI